MKRYFLSPIVGDGSIDNPYRAAVQDYPCNVSAVIPSDPTTGKPLYDWALCIVAAPNQTPLLKDNSLGPLPDFPLDAKMSAMAQASSQAMDATLRRFGVNLAGVNTSDGYRQAIRSIGQQLQADFDENGLDISE